MLFKMKCSSSKKQSPLTKQILKKKAWYLDPKCTAIPLNGLFWPIWSTTLRSLINVASQINIALYNIPKINKHSLLNKRSPPNTRESYIVVKPYIGHKYIIFSHNLKESPKFMHQNREKFTFMIIFNSKTIALRRNIENQ